MNFRYLITLFLINDTSTAWIPPHHQPTKPILTQLHANNIVLRPSSDPSAFDSSKIGTARVHRYTTDDDTSNYIMWYHGRSLENDDPNAKMLPPLSTGRIGRATSLNGLAWEKQMEGSGSEDYPGVSLGLNKESWWGFDTAHVGLGQVLLPMSTPAIISEGGIYMMYFMGGSYEETKVSDYLEGGKGGDVAIQGMKMKIGVAVSQDGITWGRVEGDDPSGAIVAPFDKNDPSQRGSVQGDIDEELYVGWPEVVVDLSQGDSENFFMYYSTMTKEGKKKAIGHAVSSDGFKWFKKGICMMPDDDEDSLDADGCARCNVLKKATCNENGRWVEQDGWIMFYEGVSKKDGKHRVMRAESKDGFTWKKTGVVLDVGENDAWDCNGVGSPCALRMDDGTIRMYYTGAGPDQSTAIGIAKTLDEDGVGFEREQAQFIFS